MTHKRSITSIAVFDRALKRLKKPFPKVTHEVAKLSAQLEDGELMGDRIPNTPHELYKVRLPNPDAQKGKSGGFRVVYYLK
ncbi:MAG: addiction module antitoxin [Anaerolineae bacterium]|nr:addiction module antitoxin [Anaerolineae bacterium]